MNGQENINKIMQRKFLENPFILFLRSSFALLASFSVMNFCSRPQASLRKTKANGQILHLIWAEVFYIRSKDVK